MLTEFKDFYSLLFEMDSSVFDNWLSGGVVETRVLEGLGRDTDDVFCFFCSELKLRLYCSLPLFLHDFLETCFAEVGPLILKARFAGVFECLVDKNTATKAS